MIRRIRKINMRKGASGRKNVNLREQDVICVCSQQAVMLTI